MIGLFFLPILLACFVLLRNAQAHYVRTKILLTDELYLLYEGLPSYIDMVLNPRHYFRWSVKQWIHYTKENKK